MRTPGSAQELERCRFQALELLKAGTTPSDVARTIGRDPSTVCKWWKRYQRRGAKGLSAVPRQGGSTKLTPPHVKRLERMLLQGPRAHGFATELWTLPRVVELIRRSFDVSYDPSGVWHLLKRMGWSCQKPERRARERDENAVAQWRRRDWPRIKKRA